MAVDIVHLTQAKHNEDVAKKLVRELTYHDWGITAAFYAAVHYFEFWLFTKPEKHSETSIPLKPDPLNPHSLIFKYSVHGWREKIIETELSGEAFVCFRELRSASETARYLTLSRVEPGREPNWLNTSASDFFTPSEAGKLLINLETLKKELKIS